MCLPFIVYRLTKTAKSEGSNLIFSEGPLTCFNLEFLRSTIGLWLIEGSLTVERNLERVVNLSVLLASPL